MSVKMEITEKKKDGWGLSRRKVAEIIEKEETQAAGWKEAQRECVWQEKRSSWEELRRDNRDV